MFLMILVPKFLFFSSQTICLSPQIKWAVRRKKVLPISPRKPSRQICWSEIACKFFCDYDSVGRKTERQIRIKSETNPSEAGGIGRQNRFPVLSACFRRMRQKESFPARGLSDKL